MMRVSDSMYRYCVVMLAILGLTLAGCATAAPAVSTVPVDTSLIELIPGNPNATESAGVSIDLSASFASVSTIVRVAGADYVLDDGKPTKNRIPASWWMTGGFAVKTPYKIAPAAKLEGSKYMAQNAGDLIPIFIPSAEYLGKLEALTGPRTVKVGDKWTSFEKEFTKFGLLAPSAYFQGFYTEWKVAGFADYRGTRCAIITYSSWLYAHNLIQNGKRIASAACAQQLSGTVAYDYASSTIVAVGGKGRSNLMGYGAITNPAKFISDDTFQTEAKSISKMVDSQNFLADFGGSGGAASAIFGTFANLKARNIGDEKIQPMFDALPAELYPALVKTALSLRVYPFQLEEPMEYDFSMDLIN